MGWGQGHGVVGMAVLSACSGRRFWGEGGSTLPVVALGPSKMGLMQAAGQGAGGAGTRPGT